MIPAALARHLATRRSTTRPTETWTWPAGSVPQLVPQPARDLRLSITAHRQIDDKKPCKMAVYDGWWRTLAIGGGWLRIRRSQVRVLPSALFEFLYLQEFSFVPSREHEASWAFDRGLTVARAQGWLALQSNYYASFRCNTALCTRCASARQAGLLLGAKLALARRTALLNARPPPPAYPETGENRYPEWSLYGSGLASLGQFEGSAR